MKYNYSYQIAHKAMRALLCVPNLRCGLQKALSELIHLEINSQDERIFKKYEELRSICSPGITDTFGLGQISMDTSLMPENKLVEAALCLFELFETIAELYWLENKSG